MRTAAKLRCFVAMRLACLLLSSQMAIAQPVAPIKLIPAQSEIVFQIKQSGVPVDGRFTKFNAYLALNPKTPETGTVTISIDTASAAIGVPETDAELPRPPWFNSLKFPTAEFRSSSIRANNGSNLEVAGKLSVKGTTKDVVIPVHMAQSGGQSSAAGEFFLKRLDFKIGEKEWADLSLVANDVRVRFKLVFSGLGPL